MSQPELNGWLNDEAVCARLGISPRTLQRQVAAHEWQPRYQSRPGKKPARVFSPEEVESKLPPPLTTAALARREEIEPTSPPMAELAELPAPTWPAIVHLVESLLAQAQAAPQSQALWVKLKEAAEISGLSVTFLRRLIASRSLAAVRDRAVKVRREDLEQLDVTKLLAKPAKKGGRR